MPWHQRARWSNRLDCSNPRSLFSWFSRGSFSANWPKSEEPLFWLSSWLQGLFPTLTSIWRSYNRETWWQNGRTSRSSWRWSTGHYHPIDSLECDVSSLQPCWRITIRIVNINLMSIMTKMKTMKSRLLLATECRSTFSSSPTTWQSRGMSISRSWFMFMMMILIKEVVTLRQSKLKILPISPPFQVKSFVVTADVYCRWTIYYAGNIWKKMLMKISSQFR